MVKILAQRGCKVQEIAEHMKCSPDTLQRRFAAEIAKGKADLKTNLREWQIQAAKKGNVAMLIWLGKQYLDQSDAQKIEHSGIPEVSAAPTVIILPAKDPTPREE